MFYVDFFSSLGFDFSKELKSNALNIEKNSTLTEKLKNSVFYYKSPNNTNTSFYLIATTLDNEEFDYIRKYIWNINDADIIFYYPKSDAELKMLYAKYSPKVTYEESILDTFSTNQKDLDKIENIKHWQFDSGAFWFNYLEFIKTAKYNGIDKELVSTLEALKKQLDRTLIRLIPIEINRSEVVQALIDRTLYIKFLEDNHIINSHFYGHYFNEETLNYGKLLENNPDADLNKLFKIIHEIFNNTLFEHPTIDDKYLTIAVRHLIATSFNANLNTGQLRLFDFQFDILPVEFISYIYEVFLSEKQKDNGIYYTPKKLAQLIVDDVINEDRIGSILDPSSGSGMFLIVGYQRLLEIAQKQGKEEGKSSIEKIKFRTQLLAENIFGIEKEQTAQRFTLFSLSLQIFNGIKPDDIKNFIANELKQNKKINLFSEYSFFENIKHANTLNIYEKPFADKKFSYIVGNPPFFEIPDTEDFKTEISFLKSFNITLDNEKSITAKDIVGKSQISQCFFIKIKDWANENTRFGFISNSSNFYNDYSERFQNYFYSNYGIEKIYELSRVKKILFKKAKESVVALIFTNNYNNNITDYYPIDLGLFSEKPLELLIIQEDKVISIEQKKIIKKEIRLRDFLIGNEYDRQILKPIEINCDYLSKYLDKNKRYSSFEGLKRISNRDLLRHYKISDKLTKNQLEELHKKYSLENYLSFERKDLYNIPFIFKPEQCIKPFIIKHFTGYINLNELNCNNFQRVRNTYIYEGKKILINRYGTEIKAGFFDTYLLFSNLIYGIKLQNENLYPLVLSLLNSKLVNYYLNLNYRYRIGDNYSNLTTEIIKKLPIPKNLDQNLVKQISDISQKLTNGKYDYSEKEKELNELIYDLYELSYWEKQRVEDYFLPKEKIGRKGNALNKYKSILSELLGFYFKNPITVEETSTDFNLKVIKLSLNQHSDTLKADKLKKYILNEIFEQNPNENFLASQEKIYGKGCVYIIKEDINKNWTETKAFEDGQDLLKHFIPNEDGERIH